MADETTTTTLAEVMRAEIVNKYIQNLNRPLALGRMLAWVERGAMAVPYKFPTFSSFTVPAGAKTQGTGDFTKVEFNTAETTCTPAFYGMSVVLTDEAELAGAADGHKIAESIVLEAVRGLEQKLDADTLAVSTSATNISGAVDEPLTIDRLLTALHAFRALNNTGETHVILGSVAASAFAKSQVQSTASSLIGDPQFKLPLNGAYLGTCGGAHIWQSSSVADADSGSNNSNVITCAGKFNSGIGLVMPRPIEYVATRGRAGELNMTTQHVFRMGYATTMTRADKLVEFLTT